MKYLVFGFVLVLVLGCSLQQEDESIDLSDLTNYKPNQLVEFDEVGGHFLTHIAYTSTVLSNGNILFADRKANEVYLIDPSGELISVVASSGRGPGELQDVTFLAHGLNNKSILFDQMNRKVLVIDSEGILESEFILPAWEIANAIEVYEIDQNLYAIKFISFEFLFDPDANPESALVLYDSSTEQYLDHVSIDGKMFAQIEHNGVPVGGREVPFSPDNLIIFNHQLNNLYLFKNDEPLIHQIDSTLDTVSVSQLNLPSQKISEAEILAIREDNTEQLWDTMRNILPEYKTISDKVLVDDLGQFWFKLNYQSDEQQWLVTDSEFKLLHIVEFPKDVMITHVSTHHIGVRVDDYLFAIFEPVP